MDDDTLKRAVEPFFSTKGVGKGTGLGLSMVHGLAVQSGGTLRLSARLVKAPPPSFSFLQRATPPQQRTTLHLDSGPRHAASATVLLVDDDALIAMSTAMMLEDLGHRVIEANSGADALRDSELSGERRPAFTDHAMPEMTGTELARHARDIRPDLPILLATGYAELPDRAAVDLPRLAKPSAKRGLAVELAKLLHSSS